MTSGAVTSSFRFHEQLESPFDFIRREWRAIAVFGGGFTALMVAVIFLVDQSFFYPRLETDALLYYLKAKSLADAGTTAARLAVNLPPFPYASMPGALRAPFLRVFSEFDDQLRAIQLGNVVIVDTVALMSAYVVSWILPRTRHWLAIGFAFGFTLLSPWWMANTFLPLADAPYAAFSLLSVIIAIRAIASPRSLVRAGPITAFAVVFVIAFLVRYTEPVVLIFVAALIRGRMPAQSIKWKAALVGLGLASVVVGLLIYMNREAIIGRYIVEPFGLFRDGDKQSIVLNFFFLAVPAQVIPGFALGFSHPPIIDLYHAQFGATRFDALWSTVGAMITGVVALGAWRLKGRMLPELLMVLAVLPVLVAMMPSTSRYFMTYQPFFWIAFYEGLLALSVRIPEALRRSLVSHAGALAVLALAIGLGAGVKARATSAGKIAGLADLPRYVHGVSGTYRPLRQFLQSLPRDRTVLTSRRWSFGRWKAIANLDSYAPDSNLVALTTQKDVYAVIECGSVDICSYFDKREASTKDALCLVGEFDYELVFHAKDEKSEAKVFRIRPAR